MSWYMTYYLIRKDPKDGKLYPLGPFDYKNDFKCALSRSRSFASDLHEQFTRIDSAEDRKSLISEELFNAIYDYGTDEDNENYIKEFYDGERDYIWSYLPFKDLPKGDYIKKGYVLIDDIERYENDKDGYFDGFYGVLSPSVYAKKLENELKFGAPKPYEDEFGETITPKSMSEYSYYVWPDYDCIEYECHAIREAVYSIVDSWDIEDGTEDVYILLTQG